MHKFFLRVLPILLLFFGKIQAVSLQSDIDRATDILSELPIPPSILKNAKGIVVMSYIKAGFIWSGKIGSGIVLAQRNGKWSAPSGVGMGGAGWGLQIGANVTEFVLVINSETALENFAEGGNITLGGALSVAVGPVGATAEGGVGIPYAPIYIYGMSEGLFAGASLEGSVIFERSSANRRFYGKPVTPSELLTGKIPPPKSADELYKELELMTSSPQSF